MRPASSYICGHGDADVVVVPRPAPVEGDGSRVWTAPTILVIDRQALFLAALRCLLAAQPLSATVRAETTSSSALEGPGAAGADVILCEMDAQPVSGPQLVTALRAEERPVPVILLSESIDAALVAPALSSGAAGLFTKDASPDELVEGVRAVLAGHLAVGERVINALLDRAGVSEPKAARPPSVLSQTELDILGMIGEAKSIPAIASVRGISQKTVRNHLANIYRKLELRNRTEAMLCAARMGLVAT